MLYLYIVLEIMRTKPLSVFTSHFLCLWPDVVLSFNGQTVVTYWLCTQLIAVSLSLCLPDGGGDLLSQIMQWITQKHNHPKSHTINLSVFLFTNTQTHTEQVSCWVGATWWLSPVYNKCLQPPGLQSSRHASRRSTCCACVALFLHS